MDKLLIDVFGGMDGQPGKPRRIRERQLPKERRVIGQTEQKIAKRTRLQIRQQGRSLRIAFGALDQIGQLRPRLLRVDGSRSSPDAYSKA